MTNNEIMPHRFYVVQDYDKNNHVWTREEYDKYICGCVKFGAGSAFKVVIGFNGDEDFLSHRPTKDTKEDDKDFESYIQKARDEFVFAVTTHFPGTVTRIAAENILVAYDQMRDKLFNASPVAEQGDAIAMWQELLTNIETQKYKYAHRMDFIKKIMEHYQLLKISKA